MLLPSPRVIFLHQRHCRKREDRRRETVMIRLKLPGFFWPAADILCRLSVMVLLLFYDQRSANLHDKNLRPNEFPLVMVREAKRRGTTQSMWNFHGMSEDQRGVGVRDSSWELFAEHCSTGTKDCQSVWSLVHWYRCHQLLISEAFCRVKKAHPFRVTCHFLPQQDSNKKFSWN